MKNNVFVIFCLFFFMLSFSGLFCMKEDKSALAAPNAKKFLSGINNNSLETGGVFVLSKKRSEIGTLFLMRVIGVEDGAGTIKRCTTEKDHHQIETALQKEGYVYCSADKSIKLKGSSSWFKKILNFFRLFRSGDDLEKSICKKNPSILVDMVVSSSVDAEGNCINLVPKPEDDYSYWRYRVAAWLGLFGGLGAAYYLWTEESIQKVSICGIIGMGFGGFFGYYIGKSLDEAVLANQKEYYLNSWKKFFKSNNVDNFKNSDVFKNYMIGDIGDGSDVPDLFSKNKEKIDNIMKVLFGEGWEKSEYDEKAEYLSVLDKLEKEDFNKGKEDFNNLCKKLRLLYNICNQGEAENKISMIEVEKYQNRMKEEKEIYEPCAYFSRFTYILVGGLTGYFLFNAIKGMSLTSEKLATHASKWMHESIPFLGGDNSSSWLGKIPPSLFAVVGGSLIGGWPLTNWLHSADNKDLKEEKKL